MSQVSFWTAASYGSHSQSVGQTLLGKVDSYFYIGKKVEVIPNSRKGKTEEVKIVDASFSRLETTAKVISYFTIIFPLILFCAKIILRSKHRFCYVQQGHAPTGNTSTFHPTPPTTHNPFSPTDLQRTQPHSPFSPADLQWTRPQKTPQEEQTPVSEPLLRYRQNSTNNTFAIIETEGKLVVMKENRPVDKFLTTALLEASPRKKSYLVNKGISIKSILEHPYFANQRSLFIQDTLKPDKDGNIRLSKFSDLAISNILESAHTHGDIDNHPLFIGGEESKQNIFSILPSNSSKRLIKKLTNLFSEFFLSIGEGVIVERINNHKISLAKYMSDEFIELGGKLDKYNELWIAVANVLKPDENFWEKFRSLTADKQKELYDLAFEYNNPFIHEPSDPPIKADQYSVNLLWINERKMSDDDEFLFCKGTTPQERKDNFQKKFVTPIAAWAIAHPETSINIWYDSTMAHSRSIENAQKALAAELAAISHSTPHFRDVREIDVVSQNAEIFNEKTPIYFRVDLLRAIVADHTLRSKDSQFFVYGDIDMPPLSGKELFDKRTINFLDKFGFVMAKRSGSGFGFEMGFQILNKNHFAFMESHRKVIIDLSVELALEITNPEKKEKTRGFEVIRPDQIYETYPAMFIYLLDLTQIYGPIKKPSENWFSFSNIFSSKQKASDLFRFDNFRENYGVFNDWGDSHLPLESQQVITFSKTVPTKPVQLPHSHVFGTQYLR